MQPSKMVLPVASHACTGARSAPGMLLVDEDLLMPFAVVHSGNMPWLL